TPPLVEMEGPGPVDQLHGGLRGDLPAPPSGQVRQGRAALAQRTTGIELPEQRRPAVDGDGPGGPGDGRHVRSVARALRGVHNCSRDCERYKVKEWAGRKPKKPGDRTIAESPRDVKPRISGRDPRAV